MPVMCRSSSQVMAVVAAWHAWSLFPLGFIEVRDAPFFNRYTHRLRHLHAHRLARTRTQGHIRGKHKGDTHGDRDTIPQHRS